MQSTATKVSCQERVGIQLKCTVERWQGLRVPTSIEVRHTHEGVGIARKGVAFESDSPVGNPLVHPPNSSRKVQKGVHAPRLHITGIYFQRKNVLPFGV